MSNLISIEEAVMWVPNLDVEHPIRAEDVSDFSRWVMYGGFKQYHNSGRQDETHLGHDFISYLDMQGNEHFRLLHTTPVRAIADGEVISIIRGKDSSRFSDYELYMIIQHNAHGLASGYAHVVPSLSVGDRVRKGEVIATLYDTSPLYPDISLPTSLHLELGNSRTLNRGYPFLKEMVDPLEMIPGLKAISVKPTSPFPPDVR